RLKQRYDEFKELFPYIEWLDREEIEEVEPNVVEGRDEDTKLRALFSDQGYRIDYNHVTKTFIEDAQEVRGKTVDTWYGKKVNSIDQDNEQFRISCEEDVVSNGLIVAAGGYSLPIARSIGLGKDLMILTVDGSYLTARNQVNGKVYMMQNPKLPFAAVHGDADVHHEDETRFGPVSRMIPLMEKRNPETWKDFLKLFDFRWDAFASIASILSDPTYIRYVCKQFLYALPIAGKWFYMQEVKKIIPEITYGELKVREDLGEIRPQVVDIEEREIQLGEAKITKPGVVFDITPSPGASVCLRNAERNAKHLVNTLNDYSFYYSKFNDEYR
ncbi:MAG: FAD-dependent oxidoreductase, partial [Halobacteriaceae archaeon]